MKQPTYFNNKSFIDAWVMLCGVVYIVNNGSSKDTMPVNEQSLLSSSSWSCRWLNTLRPGQFGGKIADDIFKCIFFTRQHQPLVHPPAPALGSPASTSPWFTRQHQPLVHPPAPALGSPVSPPAPALGSPASPPPPALGSPASPSAPALGSPASTSPWFNRQPTSTSPWFTHQHQPLVHPPAPALGSTTSPSAPALGSPISPPAPAFGSPASLPGSPGSSPSTSPRSFDLSNASDAGGPVAPLYRDEFRMTLVRLINMCALDITINVDHIIKYDKALPNIRALGWVISR